MEAACREPDAGRRGRGFGPGPAGARPPAGEEAGGMAAAPHRPRLPQPLARRLLRLLRVSARDDRLPLVHALRPAQPAAVDRLRELPLPAASDDQIWPAVYNTLWIIVVGVPLQVLFAFGIAVMLTRAKRGSRHLPDDLLPAGADPARRRDARVRLPPQPGHGTGQTCSSSTSGSRDRSGSTTPAGQSRRS